MFLSCSFPIPQAAECILRIVEKANAPVIYLSTDAAESETNLLQSLVVFNDRQVPLVKRPEHNSSEKWDALLYRNHMGGDNQVLRMNPDTIFSYEPNFEPDRLTEQQSTFAMLVQVDAMLDKTICALSNVIIRLPPSRRTSSGCEGAGVQRPTATSVPLPG